MTPTPESARDGVPPSFGTYERHLRTQTSQWSDQLYRILGVEPGSITPGYEQFSAFVHPEDRARLDAVHVEVLREPGAYHTITRIVRSDGQVRWLALSGEVQTDADGVPEQIRGVCLDVTDQRLAAGQSVGATVDMAAVLGASPDAVLVVEQSGRIQQANHQAVALFGYTQAELVGMQVERLVPEDLRTPHHLHREGYNAAPRNRTMAAGLELSAQRADGSTVPVDIHLAPLAGPGGTHVAVFVRDATERRSAQALGARLELVARRRQQALEINDNVVQGLASAGYAIETGQLATAASLIAATLAGARSMMDELLVEVSQDELDPDHLVREDPAPSGLVALVAPAPVRIAPQATRVVIIDDAADIRLLIRLGLEEAGMAVVAEGADGQEGIDLATLHRPDVVIMDLAMPRVDGLTALPQVRSELPDATVIILSGFGQDRMADEAYDRGADLYMEKGRPISDLVAEIRARHDVAADRGTAGTPGPVAAPPSEPDGSLHASAALTHELRTPLTVIGGMVETLASNAGSLDVPTRDAVLAALTRNVEHMRTILDAVADASNAQTGDVKVRRDTFDVAPLLTTLVRDLDHVVDAGRVEFTGDLSGRVAVTADAQRVRQILTNLLTNAAKFSPPGSAISVEVTAADDGIEISVVDTGSGVPTERRHLLFQPYARLADQPTVGLGLGLYLSRELARAQGGDLVYRPCAVGSRFTLHVPGEVPPSQPASRPSSTRPVADRPR